MELEEAIKTMKEFIKDTPKLPYDCIANHEIEAVETILNHLTKQEKMIHEAYAKANNYLYFNDSSDYEAGLWEVIRSLRPDLAEKWDNGDCEPLKYIEEESE